MSYISKRANLVKRFKNCLRPLKRITLRFLVIAKRLTFKLIFRISRFFQIISFFLSGVERNQFDSPFAHREAFNNYLKLGFSKIYFVSYSLFFSQQLSIGIIGKNQGHLALWAENVSKTFNAKIHWNENDQSVIKQLRSSYLQDRTDADFLIIDGEAELPSTTQVLELLMARKKLRPQFSVSAVHPSYTSPGNLESAYQGFVYDSTNTLWKKNVSKDNVFNQNTVPTWSLKPHWHCLLLSATALKQLNYSMEDNLRVEDEIELFTQALWKQNRPIICYPNFHLNLKTQTFEPKLNPLNQSWIINTTSCEKVIFVLPATTLSGGIRVVFEVAEGLSARGIETEIWSLKTPVSWKVNSVVLRQFQTYSALIHSLSVENAIKVATWWETADVVFLSSYLQGLPVQFVQEFETWFYPDDPAGQAAVVSSYRPEFQYITTATYQLEELKSIGLKPCLIPVGYDSDEYFEIPEIERERGVILALGRSFFQKNFEMTARAWQRISKSGSRLWLFGHEPGILTGSNVTYFNRPSNSEVNELLNRAEVFVQTSIHEGFSLPIIEAMATGCAVITTDSHGNRDFCFDGVNCLIVDQDDDIQLSEAIEVLLKDEALRIQLVSEALKTAENFRWSKLLDQYHSYFSALRGLSS